MTRTFSQMTSLLPGMPWSTVDAPQQEESHGKNLKQDLGGEGVMVGSVKTCQDARFISGFIRIDKKNNGPPEETWAKDDSMENEISTAETEQEDSGSNGAEPITEISNSSPAKRGRGRPPQGSKKLKVCVTDVNLMISNGESIPTPKRGRGRPRLSDKVNTKQQDGQTGKTHKSPGRPKGSKNKTSKTDTAVTNSSPKKRGRPRKILSPEAAAGDVLPNGESDKPKKGRGRPKGSVKRKLEGPAGGQENDGSSVIRRKVGRPKGSLNKKPRLSNVLDYDAGNEEKGQRRKVEVNYSEARKKQDVGSGEQPVSRGRGRPKGSLNKKKHGKVGRPRKVKLLPPSVKRKRGRPKKPLGRPRKHPLPSPEELKKPKVWKPLGRPRKYPRVDPPEGTPPAPTRSPGRPRKSESKKGAHLRKPVSTLPSASNDGAPRKRGRPPGSGKKYETSGKRGRPKGSVNKNKNLNATQIASELPTTEFCPVGEDEEVEQNVEMMPIEVEAEEMLAEQEPGLEVVNQA